MTAAAALVYDVNQFAEIVFTAALTVGFKDPERHTGRPTHQSAAIRRQQFGHGIGLGLVISKAKIVKQLLDQLQTVIKTNFKQNRALGVYVTL